MKTIKNVLISLAMSFLFINIAMANHYDPVLKVEAGMEKRLYLSLENVSEQIIVRILDREGFIFVEEKVTNTGKFKKVFNLETLPLGAYTLIIKSNVKETIQPITITGKELIMDDSKRTVYFTAKFLQKRKNVTLSLLNPTNSVVRVFIIGPAGRMHFQDAIKDQMAIEKNYNLKRLPAGNYTVIVDNANEVITRHIKLR